MGARGRIYVSSFNCLNFLNGTGNEILNCNKNTGVSIRDLRYKEIIIIICLGQ